MPHPCTSDHGHAHPQHNNCAYMIAMSQVGTPMTGHAFSRHKCARTWVCLPTQGTRVPLPREGTPSHGCARYATGGHTHNQTTHLGNKDPPTGRGSILRITLYLRGRCALGGCAHWLHNGPFTGRGSRGKCNFFFSFLKK